MGKFVTKVRSNGEHQFNLVADNGLNILSSEGYTTVAGCENGIESVRKNSTDSANFEKKVAANGKYYFNLKASNGQVIGTSEMYDSEESRDNGIASVMANASDASVE